MIAYKLKEDFNPTYQAGRLFINHNGEAICLATPVEPTIFCGNYLLHKLQHSNLFIEVELEQENWAHPHLYKPIKVEIYKNLENNSK